MTRTAALLALLTMVVSACTTGGPGSMAPSGGAAGRMGPGYCFSPPAGPNERTQWNRLCFGKD